MQGRAPVTATTPLCAYADTSAWSGSSRQLWQISIGAGAACSERFLVDLSRRQIFFDFAPSFSWPGADSGNDIRISCAGVEASDYTPCSSRLFEKKGSNRRILRRDAVVALFDGNDGQSLLDDAREERERATVGGIQTRYKNEFAEATTLEKIIAFEQEWGLFDLNKLVPKLQPLKRRLLHERYLASFREARTKADFSRFIETYGDDDPDRLVPQARQKLAAAQAVDQARERALREKQAAAQRIQAQAAKRKEAQARVANCKRMTVMAYATLERERSIAAVSGVENLAVKRQAGEIIVACQQVIGRGY
ncbi:hypothetical protein O4H52_15460 [Sphingomonadaceae bacterium G21617-S1]|nr:hypothetical protein [Sphingomonadaceae bacterium G21617-S1]